ncbi:MAG: hypothetical protein WEB50_08550 [Vicinamibacterales bacterium]
MRHRLTIPAVLAGVLAAGCLQKEVTHTLYLSPDGAVRWTVDEAGVYSDEEDVGKRIAEEQGFIGPALIGEHTTAQGFRAMGPDGLVRTTVVRDERPFHVITETHFFRADRAFERLLKGVGIRGSASLVIDGNRGSLRIRFDYSREPEPGQEQGGPVVRMLEDLDELRFVLTEGKFIAGGGFDVPDRAKAVISREWIEAASKAEDEKRAIELVLTWQLWEGTAGEPMR